MDEIEVPPYFICPISLQIMKDPVAAITGITYDRDSIEQWLFHYKSTTCPVTKQQLPGDSDLTPNHTLRRLIQAWCTQNASFCIDRIPTPKPPINKFHVMKLVKDMKNPKLQLKTLRQLELVAAETERNEKYLLEAGVPKAMILFILSCFKNSQIDEGLQEALIVLQYVKIPSEDINMLLEANHQILDSFTWVLGCEMENSIAVKSHVVLVLSKIIQNSPSRVLERLSLEFFQKVLRILRNGIVTKQGLNAALNIFLAVSSLGRNWHLMVERGAVFELIELELTSPEKKTTELIFGILSYLCSCADGRVQFLDHKGGLAMLTERILKVSPVVDDRAMFILSMILKFWGTQTVLREMLNVGSVLKLCMLLQSYCGSYLKYRAQEILKSHGEFWKKSSCYPARSFQASFPN